MTWAEGTAGAKSLSFTCLKIRGPVWQEHSKQGGTTVHEVRKVAETDHVWACTQGEGLGFIVKVYVGWGVVGTGPGLRFK